MRPALRLARRGVLSRRAVIPATAIYASSGAAGGGTGTEAAPFNTLAAAVAALGTGGTLRLAKGSVFRENLTITQANAVVEAYGSGAAPIVSGGTLLTSWTNESGNLWYATGVSTEPMLVTFNGTRGARRFYKMKSVGNASAPWVTISNALLNAAEWWWDQRNSRLYVYSTTNPASAWTTVERAERVSPIRVQATGVSITGLMVSHHNLDDRTNGIAQNGNAPTLTSITTQHSGDDVVDYWTRPGRNDSLWNTRLTGAETLVDPPAGFTTMAVQLADWASPKMGTRVVQATGSDPLMSLYYHPNVWTNVNNATWARSGNSSTIENTIMSGASATWTNPRFIYSTISTTSGVGTMPTDPLWDPYPNPSPGPFQFRCPAGVVPPPDSDGFTAIYQPDGTVVELYCPVFLSTGTNANKVVAFGFSVTESYGLLNARRPGVCASMIPDYAGCARDGALQGADKNAPHAIACYLPEAHLAKSAVLPALTWDRTNSYAGTLPMGTRLALPASVDIAARAWWTTTGYRLAQALQEYGMIVVDRNGGTGMTWKTQHGSTTDTQSQGYSTSRWEDIDWIRTRLKVVSP